MPKRQARTDLVDERRCHPDIPETLGGTLDFNTYRHRNSVRGTLLLQEYSKHQIDTANHERRGYGKG